MSVSNTSSADYISSDNFVGSKLIPIFDVWSSSFPREEFAVFDSDLRCVYFRLSSFGQGSDKGSFLGKKYSEFGSNFLPIDDDRFVHVLKGTSFEIDSNFENRMFRIRISLLKFPDNDSKLIFLACNELGDETNQTGEISNLTERQIAFLKQEQSLYREIISIFNWRQEIEGKGGNRIWMRQALPNLNTSLMQGSGIGALITSLGALFDTAQRDEKNAIVPLAFMDLLEENFQVTKRLIKTMADAQIVFEENSLNTEELSLAEVLKVVDEQVDYMQDMLQIKKQNVVMSILKNIESQKIIICKDALKTIVREIFINAMKYSPEGAEIIVLYLRTENNFIMKFINPPNYKEIENLDCKNSEEIALFQPFFRLKKAVDERYTKEEFGIGLGLPIVRKLAEDMNARVYFTVTKSNIYEKEEREVCISIQFQMVES
ncbi:sensor histidine kinase [Leptospira andrefontaineae]|uniref:histidine kinase n=1 Tax=Leptospira andrefontaineae TaxID=2484976 RepID=A0A4R9HAG8_9LEPT|nr:ATP-binding protein [Leptospira andrefontaineae]TGK43485.1 ATP-binding protein [Leptospira andrefontaineae]